MTIRGAVFLLIVLSACVWFTVVFGADLPNPAMTPGLAKPGVTATDLCPVAHTPALRHVSGIQRNIVFGEYDITRVDRPQYEVDHLISLELGGANDVTNLWPEPYSGTVWNAHVKDILENKMHALVCAGTLNLGDAQHEIATNWIGAFKRYVRAVP